VDITDATGQRKKSYADGVMVTQVVPYYKSQAPGIASYRADIARYDAGPNTFTSLEGYIAARLFVRGLKANGPILSDDTLVEALTTKLTDIDIGIGTRMGFSSTGHQASHTVWGSRIAADGTFTVPFIWDPVSRIVAGSN